MKDKNEELIKQFLKHLEQGKPILRTKRKPLSEKTLKKYRLWYKKISMWFDKDLTKLTEEDIDTFRNKLKNDTFRKINGKPYDPNTKSDIESKMLGLLLKWLDKPELFYYTDQYRELKEIPALSEKEINKIILNSKLRNKVIFSILFDAGLRADEFLNLRFCDIKDEERQSKGIYKIRVTKTKTFKRTINLVWEDTTPIIDAWLEQNPDKIGTTQPLIELSYTHLRKNVINAGKGILKKKIYPHMLRHSSATHYCNKLTAYGMSKRYGWTMSSNMVNRYIDREGVHENELVKKSKEEIEGNYRKEVNQLREKLRIQEENQRSKDEMLKKYFDNQEEQIKQMEKKYAQAQKIIESTMKHINSIEKKRKKK